MADNVLYKGYVMSDYNKHKQRTAVRGLREFLKNLNEYKDYKKFANKIKKQIHFSNNSIQQDNQISTSIADSSIKKNNVFVYDYQHNNISLKNRLDFSK